MKKNQKLDPKERRRQLEEDEASSGGLLIKVSAIIVLLALICGGIFVKVHFSSSMSPTSILSEKARPSTPEEYEKYHASHTTYEVVNIDKLLDDIENDRKNATQKYVGKLVQIENGYVSSVSPTSISVQGSSDGKLAHVESDSVSVNDRTVAQQLNNFKAGQNVTLRGVISKIDASDTVAYIFLDKIDPASSGQQDAFQRANKEALSKLR